MSLVTADKGGLVIGAPIALLATLPAAGGYGALTIFTGLIAEDQQRSLTDYWKRGIRMFWRSWLGSCYRQRSQR